MKTIPDMLAGVVAQNAERTAVVDGETVVSYEELARRIASLSEQLYEAGVRRGDRVGLLLPNSLDFVTSYFGILTLGALVVPLNEHYQRNELLYFLEQCGVSLVVTSDQFAQLCYEVQAMFESPCRMLLVDDQKDPSTTSSKSLGDFRVEIDPDSPVMYQFSSGSTGTPKRIARTHTNLLFELDGLMQTLDLTNEDRFLGAAPFSHVNGLMRSMMACMRAGATLYPVAKFERRRVAQLIERNQISIFISVPFMFIALAKTKFRPQPDLSSLRLSVSASAAMPKRLNQQFYEKFGIYVRQLYGSTETGTISVNLTPDIENSLESVGTPIKGVEVEVLTEDGRVAGADEMGEFAVKSPAAITAYDGLDDVNQETFRDGYFFTGDLGTRGRDRLLYLVGRKKFFINKGGFKIDPREIEELIESHPEVEEAVVLGLPAPYGDERVKAVIVLTGSCTEEEIVKHCQGKIADFKIPSVVEFRDSLPKSPTGKVRRRMLM